MYDLNGIIASLQSCQDLSLEQMKGAVSKLLAGEVDLPTTKRLLGLLATKGECIEELVGAAQAMRETMLPVHAPFRPVLDTCGTGGDGSQTFNISTAAAIALAAAGAAVAKHGNRKITSQTGSADVLAVLGITLEISAEMAERCLREVGICFCFAPVFHPAMKHVGEARRQLGHPTIFNRLGPLTNPALADCQLLGVGKQELVMPMAQTLQRLGTQHSLVVRGQDGVDEISISAPTTVVRITPTAITQHQWTPADFGVAEASRETLYASDPESSAQCIRDVFAGMQGPQRDIVIMNAAAALWLAKPGQSLTACAAEIAAAIDDGRAAAKVAQLAAITSEQ